MVDQERIRRKVHFVRQGLRTLDDIKNRSLSEFQSEPYIADACLRNMQTVIEALLDIGNHIIARHAYGLPKTHADVIRILVSNGVLKPETEAIYVRMVRFRNRIVHLYDDVSIEEVYSVLQNNLEDFRTFVAAIIQHSLQDGEDDRK